MTPDWAEKLKKYRKDKTEAYAKTILSPPIPTNLYAAMRFPGVAIIMGDIRSGKTGVAHEIAHEYNKRRGLPAVLHLPHLNDKQRKVVQKMVPPWMTVSTKRSQWPQRSVVIYDEAAQSAHARRNQSADAMELDDLLSIAGQREQLVLFISHYSRKLDINVCTGVHRIIWKRPTFAHQLWERDEMADFTGRAFDFFTSIPKPLAQKKACLILDMDNFGFHQCTNKLPPWWNNELSCIFRDFNGKPAPTTMSKGGLI